jgi:hypothetical protein
MPDWRPASPGHKPDMSAQRHRVGGRVEPGHDKFAALLVIF